MVISFMITKLVRLQELIYLPVTRQQQLLTTSELEVQYASDYALLNYLAGIQDTTVISVDATVTQYRKTYQRYQSENALYRYLDKSE